MLASYHSTLIMPPKKGRYITAAACARAGKAALHRVQTPASSEPAASEENGPDNSGLLDLDQSSAVPVNDDLDLTDHHHILAAGLTDDSQSISVTTVIIHLKFSKITFQRH